MGEDSTWTWKCKEEKDEDESGNDYPDWAKPVVQ